jgi:hypothetical protein
MSREMVVAYFKALYMHSLGHTEETAEKNAIRKLGSPVEIRVTCLLERCRYTNLLVFLLH